MAKSNTAIKWHANEQQNPWIMLLLGLVFLGLTYGFASWAIDSGRWSTYAATIICLFAGLRFLALSARLFIKK